MTKKTITYSQSGVNYEQLDPAKKLALSAAKATAKNLTKFGLQEIEGTRGEAAYVWQQGKVLMAAVTESLGTKNLVADEMRKITGKTYYDTIGYDSVASIVNDLASVGAQPLVVHAFWAVGESGWFDDIPRIEDLVKGWQAACNDAGATWGGGETPSYNNIVINDKIALGGSSVGMIKSKNRLLLDENLRVGDRILLIKSNGINANGLSLARAVAKKLKKGYATKMSDGTMYGEAILTKTHIYAPLIQDLLDNNIHLHYISNITGHGMRKIMRARQKFTYVIEKIIDPQELFLFVQKYTGMSDKEIYATYNMGMDYALFLPEKDMKKALKIVEEHKHKGISAGYVEKGDKKVVIEAKNITYSGESLDLR
jgi:phosphoribosylformylglycinamidine cyclo-ligase